MGLLDWLLGRKPTVTVAPPEEIAEAVHASERATEAAKMANLRLKKEIERHAAELQMMWSDVLPKPPDRRQR